MAKTTVNSQDIRDANVTLPDLGALTTKGDLLGFAATHVRIPVGANGLVLTADSSNANGVAWAATSGTGTVTSVAGGVGITNSPEPITATGTVDLDINSLTSGSAFATGDLLAFVDVSVGTTPASQRKLTIGDLQTFLGGAFQPLDTGLTNLAALTPAGFAVTNGSDVWASRTLVAPAAGITISNTTGGGNPAWGLANDLAALEGLTGTGLSQRLGVDNWALITPVRGNLIVGNATPLYAPLTIGAPARYLRSDGTDPSWQQIAYADIAGTPATLPPSAHNFLDSTVHNNTLTGLPVRGDIMIGNATPAWSKLAISTSIVGSLLTSDTVDPSWAIDLTWSSQILRAGVQAATNSPGGDLRLFKNSTTNVTLIGVGDRPTINIYRAGTSLAAPTSFSAGTGTSAGALNFGGHDGNALYAIGAAIRAVSTEAWSGTAHGMRLTLGVVAVTTTTLIEALSIESTHIGIPDGKELRLFEPSGSGVNYSALKAQAQAANLTYTLPATLLAGGVLTTDGAGVLTWNAPGAPGLHNFLDSTVHNNTVTGVPARGDLIVGNATPAWAKFIIGANATYLRSNGTDPQWVLGTANDDFTQYVAIAGRTTTLNNFLISQTGAAGGTLTGSAVSGAPIRVFANSGASSGQLILNPTATGLPAGLGVGGVAIPLSGLSFGGTTFFSALNAGFGLTWVANVDDSGGGTNLCWFNPIIESGPVNNSRTFGKATGLTFEPTFRLNATTNQSFTLAESSAVRHTLALTRASTTGLVQLSVMTDVFSRPDVGAGCTITTRRGLDYREALTTPSGVQTSIVVDVVDTNATVTNIVVRSLLSAAGAGGIKRNLLFSGDAVSVMVGGLRIGDTTAPTQKLEVLGHVLLDNSGTASEVRFREPSGSGANYTAFKAQAQAADLTYTLPAAIVTNGVLTTSAGGTLTWAATAPATPHNLLSATHGDTNAAATPAGGDMIWFNNGSSLWDVLPNSGVQGDVLLITGAAVPGFTTLTGDGFSVTGAGVVSIAGYTKLAGRTTTTNDTLLSTSGTQGGKLTGSSVAGAPLILNATSDSVLFPIQLGSTALSVPAALRGVLQFGGAALNFSTASTFAAYIVGRVNNTAQTWTIDATPTGANLFFFGPIITNTPTDTTLGGGAWNGLLYQPDFRMTSAAAASVLTVTAARALNNQLTLSRSATFGSVVVTDSFSVRDAPTIGTNCTITTRTGLLMAAPGGAGAQTNVYGVDFADQTGGTVAAVIRSSLTDAAAKFFLKDEGGAQSAFAGKFTRYNNVATEGVGMPSIVKAVDLTAQAAAATTAALWTPAAAGFYRISFAITLTRAATISSIVGAGVNVNYTTGDGATASVQNVPMWIKTSTTATVDIGDASNTIGTTLIGSVVIYSSTTAVTYDIGYTSVGGTTMQYAARIRVEAL